MPKKLDLAGKQFGRLTVIEQAKNVGRRSAWKCICACGKERIATSAGLMRGYTKSCGCLVTDIANEQKTVSVRNTRIYKCWTSIKQRCTNPNSPSYGRYGGRGITICTEWSKSFTEFKRWSEANGYTDSLEIDRINNDAGYRPDNCRWITHKENCQNRSDSKRIKYLGKTYSAAGLARKFGIAPSTFREWIRLRGIEYALARTDAPTGAESEGVE